MNVFQKSCRSIVGVLLVFLLQGSCDDEDVEVVNRAIGDSLDLPANYSKDKLHVDWKYNETTFAEYEKDNMKLLLPSLFQERIKMNKDNISITIGDLKIKDSGKFSIVAVRNSVQQLPTKLIILHVHEIIRDVKIEYNISWLPSKNCMVHLQCQAVGNLNASFSWSVDQVQSVGQHLNISLHPAENSTVTCTANSTVSTKSTTMTVDCTEKITGFFQEYWWTIVGISVIVVVVVIFSAIIAVCIKKHKGNAGDSGTGITVYEDVNTEVNAKKRSESVVNGMSIYETVDDLKPTPKLQPQTLYDQINFQRHPPVSTSTPSNYQEVL